MKLVIDDANIEIIKHIYEYYPVDGVTTNPSILSKAGKNPFDTLKEIRSIIGPDAQLHAQAVSKTAEGMVEEGHRIIKEVGDKTFIKIPAIEEGFKAMKILSSEGLNVTATVIYTPLQAYVSGMCGAKYAAPYVSRITKLGGDGIKTACDIHDIFVKNNIACNVLGASFKKKEEVLALCLHGIDAATISGSLFEELFKDSEVDSAVAKFLDDFEGLIGKGHTLLDC